ncbi:DUF1295 domain-containing protein [Nanoarchaeota archaeon]
MITLFHSLLIAVAINLALFIPAFLFKTDKLTDLSYALTFIILASLAFFFNNYSFLNLIITLMIIIWALRLGVFLFFRIRKMKRDKRFDGIRESFQKFIRFWIIQAFAVWIILIPSILFQNLENKSLFIIGIFVWAIGLIIESTADIQKYLFKKLKKNKDMFIQSGIWKYSRHPNYFGEILCWIGIYLSVFLSLNLTNKIIALVSPLFITMLLLFVTGIPPLEKSADKKWGKHKKYKDYKRKTSILIPWIPKK